MRTVLRTGTFPMIVRSDRGPEFHNAMVDELTALCGMRRIPGAAFRPTSQAPVERVHQEVQRLMGILVMGVFKAFPGSGGSSYLW